MWDYLAILSAMLLSTCPTNAYLTQATIFSPKSSADSYFGSFVSMSVNASALAVSSRSTNGTATKGEIHVYYRELLGWSTGLHVSVNEGVAFGNLSSVVINGKGNTLVAGVTDTSLGAVYIYSRSSLSWMLEARLDLSGRGFTDVVFGDHIDVSFDGSTVAIGVPDELSSAGIKCGAVYILSRQQRWLPAHKIFGNVSDNGSFGSQLTMTGQANILAVGAATSNSNRGAVHVFIDNGNGFFPVQRLQAMDATVGDRFGNSLTLNSEGDIIAVAAPLKQVDATLKQGVIYIFRRNSVGSWVQSQRITALDGSTNSQFGRRVRMDPNGLIMAVAAVASTSTVGGIVYLFESTSNNTWQLLQKVTNNDVVSGDEFGHAVAVGGGKLAASAWKKDVAENVRQGVVYIHDIPTTCERVFLLSNCNTTAFGKPTHTIAYTSSPNIITMSIPQRRLNVTHFTLYGLVQPHPSILKSVRAWLNGRLCSSASYISNTTISCMVNASAPFPPFPQRSSALGVRVQLQAEVSGIHNITGNLACDGGFYLDAYGSCSRCTSIKENCSSCIAGLDCLRCEMELDSCACMIAGKPYAKGQRNPMNNCQACDPIRSQIDWTDLHDIFCNDGEACTARDTCRHGKCIGNTYSCPLLSDQPCLLASACDGNGGCHRTYANNQTKCAESSHPCIAASFCTGLLGSCPVSKFTTPTISKGVLQRNLGNPDNLAPAEGHPTTAIDVTANGYTVPCGQLLYSFGFFFDALQAPVTCDPERTAAAVSAGGGFTPWQQSPVAQLSATVSDGSLLRMIVRLQNVRGDVEVHCTPTFVVDTSPPIPKSLRMLDPVGSDDGTSNVLWHNGYQLHFTWAAFQDELTSTFSGTLRYTYAIYAYSPTGTSTTVLGWKNATGAQSIRTDPFTTPLTHAVQYVAIVKACNKAALCSTQTSSPLTIDRTAPHTQVFDGSTFDDDNQPIQTAHAGTPCLYANWLPVVDHESCVSRVLVGLGTVAGSDDVVGFREVPLTVTQMEFCSAMIVDGTRYITTVLATSCAGSTAWYSSPGQVRDVSAPTSVRFVAPAFAGHAHCVHITPTFMEPHSLVSTAYATIVSADTDILNVLPEALDSVTVVDLRQGFSACSPMALEHAAVVKACGFIVNAAGTPSGLTCSNEIRVDLTPPIVSAVVCRDLNEQECTSFFGKDTLVFSWSMSIDEESEITGYSVSVQRTISSEFTEISRTAKQKHETLSVTVSKGQHAQQYRVCVTSRNSAGLNATECSRPVLIDTTKPVVGRVYHGVVPRVHFRFCPDDTQMSFNWPDANDTESGIRSYSVTITDAVSGSVISGPTETADRAITLQNLQLRNDVKYKATVTATSHTGAFDSAVSESCTVDTSPPEAGKVMLTPSAAATGEVYFINNTSISTYWTGFRDETSGVNFTVALGTWDNATRFTQWYNVGQGTKHTFTIPTVLQRLEIRGVITLIATNGAGRSVMVRSPPFVIERSGPEIAFVELYNSCSIGQQMCALPFSTNSTVMVQIGGVRDVGAPIRSCIATLSVAGNGCTSSFVQVSLPPSIASESRFPMRLPTLDLCTSAALNFSCVNAAGLTSVVRSLPITITAKPPRWVTVPQLAENLVNEDGNIYTSTTAFNITVGLTDVTPLRFSVTVLLENTTMETQSPCACYTITPSSWINATAPVSVAVQCKQGCFFAGAVHRLRVKVENLAGLHTAHSVLQPIVFAPMPVQTSDPTLTSELLTHETRLQLCHRVSAAAAPAKSLTVSLTSETGDASFKQLPWRAVGPCLQGDGELLAPALDFFPLADGLYDVQVNITSWAGVIRSLQLPRRLRVRRSLLTLSNLTVCTNSSCIDLFRSSATTLYASSNVKIRWLSSVDVGSLSALQFFDRDEQTWTQLPNMYHINASSVAYRQLIAHHLLEVRGSLADGGFTTNASISLHATLDNPCRLLSAEVQHVDHGVLYLPAKCAEPTIVCNFTVLMRLSGRCGNTLLQISLGSYAGAKDYKQITVDLMSMRDSEQFTSLLTNISLSGIRGNAFVYSNVEIVASIEPGIELGSVYITYLALPSMNVTVSDLIFTSQGLWRTSTQTITAILQWNEQFPPSPNIAYEACITSTSQQACNVTVVPTYRIDAKRQGFQLQLESICQTCLYTVRVRAYERSGMYLPSTASSIPFQAAESFPRATCCISLPSTIGPQGDLMLRWAPWADDIGLLTYFVTIIDTATSLSVTGPMNVGLVTTHSISLPSAAVVHGRRITANITGCNSFNNCVESQAAGSSLIDLTSPAEGRVWWCNDSGETMAIAGLATKVCICWNGFEDPESSIYNFEVGYTAISTSVSPDWFTRIAGTVFSYVVPAEAWTRVSTGNGHEVYAVVYATSGSGMTTFNRSLPIFVDISHPTAGTVQGGSVDISQYGVAAHNPVIPFPQHNIGCHWSEFIDAESHIAQYKVAVGTLEEEDSVLPWTEVGLDRGKIARISYSLGPGVYFCSVIGVNSVDLETKARSPPMYVDRSAPLAWDAWMFDGDIPSVDQNTSSSLYALSYTWGGFEEPDSYIEAYQVSFGTTCDNATGDSTSWMIAGPWTSTVIGNLQLHAGTTYFGSVRAVNVAGLTSAAVCSNGITISARQPRLTPSAQVHINSTTSDIQTRVSAGLSPYSFGQRDDRFLWIGSLPESGLPTAAADSCTPPSKAHVFDPTIPGVGGYVCDRGFFQNDRGDCTPCPPGSFKSDIGNHACTNCPQIWPIVSQPQEIGQAHCSCPSNEIYDGENRVCVCDKGFFRTTRSSCEACQNSTVKVLIGDHQSLCLSCPETSTYVEAACVCADPLTTFDAASWSCVCAAGLFMHNGTCKPCPAGTYKSTIGNAPEQCLSCPTGSVRNPAGQVACRADPQILIGAVWQEDPASPWACPPGTEYSRNYSAALERVIHICSGCAFPLYQPYYIPIDVYSIENLETGSACVACPKHGSTEAASATASVYFDWNDVFDDVANVKLRVALGTAPGMDNVEPFTDASGKTSNLFLTERLPDDLPVFASVVAADIQNRVVSFHDPLPVLLQLNGPRTTRLMAGPILQSVPDGLPALPTFNATMLEEFALPDLSNDTMDGISNSTSEVYNSTSLEEILIPANLSVIKIPAPEHSSPWNSSVLCNSPDGNSWNDDLLCSEVFNSTNTTDIVALLPKNNSIPIIVKPTGFQLEINFLNVTWDVQNISVGIGDAFCVSTLLGLCDVLPWTPLDEFASNTISTFSVVAPLERGQTYRACLTSRKFTSRARVSCSNTVLVDAGPPTPGWVLESLPRSQSDLDCVPADVSQLSVSWGGFACPAGILRYEVAVGDRPFAHNIVNFMNMDRNTTTNIHINITLDSRPPVIYTTVRVWDSFGRFAEAASDGVALLSPCTGNSTATCVSLTDACMNTNWKLSSHLMEDVRMPNERQPSASPVPTRSTTPRPTRSVTPSSTSTPTASRTASATRSQTATSSPSPLGMVKMVTVGNDFACALVMNGSAKCWGRNDAGQLGDGTTVDRNSPTKVAFFPYKNITGIHAGAHFACALLGNGSMICWGANNHLQLGTTTASPAVSKPLLLTRYRVSQLDCGVEHTCVLLMDGRYTCWGANYYIQTGHPDTNDVTMTAATLKNSPVAQTSIVQLAVGDHHSCIRISNGKAYCWGYNNHGEFSMDNFPNGYTHLAIALPFTTSMTFIDPRDDGTCAVFQDGTLRCWGANSYGEAGTGTYESPIMPTSTLPAIASGVAEVAAGTLRTCLVYFNGSMSCWGHNEAGILGYGHSRAVITPTQAGILRFNLPIISASMNGKTTGGSLHMAMCAITIRNTLRCWGKNTYGNLGYGDFTDRNDTSIIGDVPGLA